ncbi:MAG TPA: ASPIC/UnbV domain-containing protein, partial [Vicinamibacteria bacterium]|nr:ASPIC/UnbV domain-containing protein [Vicinamibacteria bacterium]
NDGGNARHWLELRLRGTKSNRMGLGARVTLRAGGLQQIREVSTAGSIFSGSDARVHFGLGDATQAQVEIRWPSGTVQALRNLPADRLLEVDEDRGVL